MARSGRCQSLCFVIPEAFQEALGVKVARALWGEDGMGMDDLIALGAPGTPPGIEICKPLAMELSLSPVGRPFRIGLVFSADKLSAAAANSLLKVTEEPPGGSKVVFLLERDNLLPTLRSRVSMFNLLPPEMHEPSSYPSDSEAWARIMRACGSGGKTQWDLPRLRNEIQGWVTQMVVDGMLENADRASRLVEILSNHPMSTSMGADMAFLTLEEGLDFA
ncbi:MAG: hypothetical protein N2315_01915 [Thermanaerothrix sp.]|nr:hypothetical protein [Thermanaerothrix sp.]